MATEDIENADEIRTILKDVWDMRQAKLRKSVDTFIQVLANRTAFMDRGALLLVVTPPPPYRYLYQPIGPLSCYRGVLLLVVAPIQVFVSANRTLVMLQRSCVIGCSPHTGICISQ